MPEDLEIQVFEDAHAYANGVVGAGVNGGPDGHKWARRVRQPRGL